MFDSWEVKVLLGTESRWIILDGDSPIALLGILHQARSFSLAAPEEGARMRSYAFGYRIVAEVLIGFRQLAIYPRF